MLALTTLFSCEMIEGYDDTELRDQISDLESRVWQLEQLCSTINTNVSSLQRIVNAMQDGDYITDVTTVTEGGKDVGYKITFSNGDSIIIYHGKDGKDGANGADGKDGNNGKDGADGYVPQISVRQDADGNWYWTLDGDWLLDDDGNKIRANGKDGKDGADGEDGADGTPGTPGADGEDGKDGQDGKDGYTPQIGIRKDTDGNYYWTLDGDWLLDDNGDKVRANGKDGKDGKDGADGKDGQDGADGKDGADGEDGKDGADGADGAGGSTVVGDSIIKELTQDDGYVYITLYDGTKFVLPKMSNAFTITFSETENIAISPNQSVKIKYTVSGATNPEIEAIGKDGWQAEVEPANATTGNIKVTAPSTRATGKVIVLVSNGAGQTLMKSLTFGEGVLTGIADCYECYAQGGDIKIEVRTNLDYTISIPDEATSWISAKVTRAEMRDETITLTIQPSTTGVDRNAQIALLGSNGSVLQSVEIIQRAVNTSTGIISFKDPEVEKICVNYFDTDQDGKLSYAEAAAVTTFKVGNSSYSIFYDNNFIRFFDELQYFTGLSYIPTRCFYSCEKLFNITLPSTISHIGDYAFYNCNYLESIHIPSSCKRIYSYAFENCTHLQVTFDEGLERMGEAAFRNCKSMEELVLPESLIAMCIDVNNATPVTTSSCNHFEGCTSLKKVTLPSHLDVIPYACFKNCTSLETVALPEWLSTIEGSAFDGCKKLQNPVFNPYLRKIGLNAYRNCQSITEITWSKNISFSFYTSDFDELTDGNGIFYGSGITKFIIPEGMTYVPSTICCGCTKLKEVVIPESVTSIDTYAFQNSGLTEFEIPEHITTINARAFAGSALESINIPTTVTSWGNEVFYDCDKLISATIEEGITSLGSLFYHCSSLTDVSLPSTLTNLIGTFEYCSALTSIELPDGFAYFGTDAFNGAGLTSISIPDGVYYIGENAFRNTKIAKIELPASVTTVGNYAFASNNYLTSIVIPDLSSVVKPTKLEKLGDYVFYNCDALKEVTIPGSIKNIGKYTFQDCDYLTTVTLSEGVETVGSYAFQDNLVLTEVNLPKSLKTIDHYAFSGCKALAEIQLPEALTALGGYAFQNCTALKEIELPNSITSLGQYMFDGCTALTKCNIPTNVAITSVPSYFFRGCSAITEITIPDNITLIGDRAFYDCSKLATVNFSQKLKTIGSYAFNACALTSIDLPATMTTLNSDAFGNCKSLATVYCRATTPPSAYSGNSDSFYGCPKTKLFVPQASILQYKNAACWSGFTTISAIPAE